MGKQARIRAARGPKLTIAGAQQKQQERARARRMRLATPTQLVTDPVPSNEEPKEEQAPMETAPTAVTCQVRGCPRPALELHEGVEMAPVWLCGRCGEIARANLLDAAREERIKDLIRGSYEQAAEHHARYHGARSLLYSLS